ncbi:uncharacterized protein LOC136039470 [Artemia franciscana]|uniref:uncharacterized protein LOC136039470 n=1 Tax=Artemia franciscana TaxID=6661 RepID=UPI0032DAC153
MSSDSTIHYYNMGRGRKIECILNNDDNDQPPPIRPILKMSAMAGWNVKTNDELLNYFCGKKEEVKPDLQSIPSTSSSSGSEPSNEQFEDMLLECKDFQENFDNIIYKRQSKEKSACRVEKSAYEKEFPVLLK